MMDSGDTSEADNGERYRLFLVSIAEMIDCATQDKDFILAAKLQACADHINELSIFG